MGGIRTDGTGQIQKTQPQQPEQGTLLSLMKALQPEMARALPKHLTADRMARVVMTALRTVPKLAQCTRESFAGCIMQLSQLGLEPNTPLGHAYLIPRWNSKTKTDECTMIIGYQGYLDLGRRGGAIAFAYVVRAGDEFNYSLGLNPTIHHVPSADPQRETQPISFVYAVARTKEFADSPIFVVLSRAQVEARKKRSASASSGYSPWQSDEEAMYLKTAIRALWKWMPKALEVAHAALIDDAADAGTDQTPLLSPDVASVLQAKGLLAESSDEPATQTVVDMPGDEQPQTPESMASTAVHGQVEMSDTAPKKGK